MLEFIVILLVLYFCAKFVLSVYSTDKCFEDRLNDSDTIINGKCKGLWGGTKYTNYLSEMCVGCKHFSD